MHAMRGARRRTRWLAVAALLGGLGLAAGSNAEADTAGSNGETIFTHIALSGDVYRGGSPSIPANYPLPICWLEPNVGFDGNEAYTPDAFGAYMGQLIALYHHTGDGDLQLEVEQIYEDGIGADPVVGWRSKPYNQGQTNGMWYEISCSFNATFADYEAFKASLGATKDVEEWFWFANGNPPAGAPVADPNLLALYAAANTKVSPRWPSMSPAVNAVQTVNLPTLVTNGKGANGFHTYVATASLPGVTPSTVYATPKSVTFSSSGMSPSSVTCGFNSDGSLRSGCQLNWYKSSAAGYQLTESTTWNVTWNGFGNERGWTRQIGPFTQAYPNPIVVQEIQTVVGGN
jgi:hypothetical protein